MGILPEIGCGSNIFVKCMFSHYAFRLPSIDVTRLRTHDGPEVIVRPKHVFAGEIVLLL